MSFLARRGYTLRPSGRASSAESPADRVADDGRRFSTIETLSAELSPQAGTGRLRDRHARVMEKASLVTPLLLYH